MSDQDESELNSATSGENFSLSDFFNSKGDTLLERVKPFSDYLRETTRQGQAHYSREITSATGPRVEILDHLTGQKRTMVMMGSNNYLGLANHPEVKRAVLESVEQYGVGMGGPPLLNGMSTLHRQLEQALAGLKGKEDALIYPSGFQANLGWLTALPRAKELIICDELHHASLFDGIRLARSMHRAQARTFRHNDCSHLEELLASARRRLPTDAHIFVAVEGVYSMDGDLAPLPEISRLCRNYRAVLCVDDAHGTGVLGENGGGTAEHFRVVDQVDIAMGTFSKTFGVTGGFIAGKRELIDYLRYFSRSYMFSAHLPQSMAAGVLAGVKLIQSQPTLRHNLKANRDLLQRGLVELGFRVSSESAILPIVLPEQVDIRLLSKRLHEEGLFCNLIEAPAVPANAQRVRLSVMADHSPEDIHFTLAVFRKLAIELKLVPAGRTAAHQATG